MFYVPPLSDVVEPMLNSADRDSAAMAWNLLSDKRISEQRVESFQLRASQWLPVIDEATLRDALWHYFNSEINARHSPATDAPKEEWPEFLRETINGRNHHGGPLADRELEPLPHGNVRLVRVVNLCGLGRVFDRARGAKNSVLGDCPPFDGQPRFAGNLLQWLDERLHGMAGADSTVLRSQPFLRALLRWMNEDRLTNPYQPAWATYWGTFALGDVDSPERWEERLGIRSDRAQPRWLLLLRYPVREARLLVRPTQLDAAWYPRHFPSPPEAGTGHPVDLGASPPHAGLQPEFIHEQIDHHPYHIVGCARAEPPPDDEFVARRHRHLGWLRDAYKPGFGWPTHPLP